MEKGSELIAVEPPNMEESIAIVENGGQTKVRFARQDCIYTMYKTKDRKRFMFKPERKELSLEERHAIGKKTLDALMRSLSDQE